MIHKNEQGKTIELRGYPQLFIPDIGVLIRWEPSLAGTGIGKL